jgi:hypothetical protein
LSLDWLPVSGLTREQQSVNIRFPRQEASMGITAPIIIIALAAVACGLGVCAIAHRSLNRHESADAHCGAQAAQGSRFSRLAPLLSSMLLCGLAMAAVLAYFQPR